MPRKKQTLVTLVSEEALERIAWVIGEQSAARAALNDLKRRRDEGEDPVVVQCEASFLVVPRADLIPA